MVELIILGAAASIGIGYVKVRRFVRERLRFVDAVQEPAAPFAVGAVAALAAAPLVWLLPVVGAGTALVFGTGLAPRARYGQLLAALFAFEGRAADRTEYLVYGFKRGTFWPFVPSGKGQERDNAEEMRLKNELEGELPIEPELERWFPLWGIPV